MKNPTIYIVEDDDATRDALRSLFVTLDFNVVTFSCVEEFLQSTYETKRACLITDFNLPGKNGIQLLKQLNHCNRSIPTIILDSSGEVKIAVKAMRTGAVDFIEKPFVDRVLVRRICNILDIRT